MTHLFDRLGRLLIVPALIVFVAAGCTDGLLMEDNGTNQVQITQTSKSRNGQLMDRALRGGVAGKDDNGRHLGLVMRVNKSSVMERYRVMERYKVMERYRVMERYEYNEVIGGYAITVEDRSGLEDYNDFLDALEADPDIAWYEPDFGIDLPERTAAASPSGQIIPWSVAAIGGTESWTKSGDGSGTVNVHVYVLDTGVSKAWNDDPNDDLLLVENVDFVGSGDAGDREGHGTHVAGIIGALDDFDNTVGVAPGARIHNLKVLGDDGTADVSVVIAAVEYITGQKRANPARQMVVNLSLGEDIASEAKSALDDALETSIAAGVHYIVAAGNGGVDARRVTPAKAEGAITVGAHDVNGVFSAFSNHGSKVDILAPGEGIISLSKDGVGTVTMSGTSMAAAHVTGAVALFVARNPAATPAEARAHVLGTARRIAVGAPSGTTTRSVWVGPEAQTVATAAVPAAASAAPRFSDYALFAIGRLEIKKESTVGDGMVNANVHGNGELKLEDGTIRIRGFGSYTDKLDGSCAGVVRPVVNPLAVPACRAVAPVAFDGFDAEAHRASATVSHKGDLKLKGTYRLGTAEKPAFVYVDGRVKTEGAVEIVGYGVIYARDNVELSHTVSAAGDVGLFSSKDVKVRSKGLTVQAALVAGGSVELDEDSLLRGSAAAVKDTQVKRGSRITFRALSDNLRAFFWR